MPAARAKTGPYVRQAPAGGPYVRFLGTRCRRCSRGSRGSRKNRPYTRQLRLARGALWRRGRRVRHGPAASRLARVGTRVWVQLSQLRLGQGSLC